MRRPPLKTCGTGVTIEHLPPELLGVIFNYVHEDVRSLTQDFEDSLAPPISGDDLTPIPDLPLDSAGKRGLTNDQRQLVINLARMPGFFPYNCARTCTTWRNVMCSHPMFWTRLVFFIDSQPTALEDVKAYMGWSRALPIDVIITFRPELSLSNDDEQKRLIDELLVVLLPHITRFQMLHIDAFSSTSLPTFQFNGSRYEAPLLTDISLSCEEDRQNRVSDFTYSTPSHDDELSFSCDSLKNISIDGLTLRRACLNDTHWLHFQNHVEQLSITESKFLLGDEFDDRIPDPDAHKLSILTALDFIECLQLRLAYLKLQNVTFDIEAGPRFPSYSYSLPRLHALFLDNVSSSSIKELFRLCDFPRLAILHLSDCTELDKSIFDDMSIDVAALFLSLISREANVAEFLAGWHGYGLCLIKCFWSSDVLLDKLSETLDLEEGETAPEGGKKFLCPNMSLLFLMICPVFSVASVKKFVEARNHYVDYVDPEWKTKTRFGPAIRTLVVKNVLGMTRQSKGTRSYHLSEEDDKWFKERLVDFTWE